MPRERGLSPPTVLWTPPREQSEYLIQAGSKWGGCQDRAVSHTKLRGLTSGIGIATGVKGSGQDPSGNSRILLLSSSSQALDSSVLVFQGRES